MSGLDPARVVGVVLAAGEGRRFGGLKALARYDGRSLLAHAVEALHGAGCNDVLVVANPAWAEAAPDDAGSVRVVPNPAWPEGMGSSLRLALADPGALAADAVLVMLADTPLVTAECVRRVLAASSRPDALTQAVYAGRRGHPVLLGRAHLDGVRAAAVGDTGARPYLARHRGDVRLVDCTDAGEPWDVDTVHDLAALPGPSAQEPPAGG